MPVLFGTMAKATHNTIPRRREDGVQQGLQSLFWEERSRQVGRDLAVVAPTLQSQILAV